MNIHLYYSYPNKLQQLINIPIISKSNSIIYQIKYSCGAKYSGETKVYLKKRIKQHQKLIDQNNIQCNSEMVIHNHNNKRTCKFNTSTAIDLEKETNWKRRRIKETIYSILVNSINKNDGIDPLWSPIISKFGEPIKRKIINKYEHK